MVSTRREVAARRVSERLNRSLAEEVLRLRSDSGLTQRALATASGVDVGYLCRIERGTERPSLETFARLGLALGADFVAHLYPNTGPPIHDRHQARILETLLSIAHPRWQAYPEVPVRRPARGFIDVVLHDAREGCVVASEIESRLARLEQSIRWSAEKAESLPSWDRYGQLADVRSTSRLLIVRATRANRAIGREFARQLEAAFPAHPADALDAITGTRPWPGAALVWVDLGSAGARFLRRR